MKGSGIKLFSHIASCLKAFMQNHNLDMNKTYPLGFTFSFPCTHSSLSKAVLLRWTKGFNCSDVGGENVVELMQNAIDQLDIKVKVTVLINDTVGTLMSCAYTDPSTGIGLILGTGTNACYVESVDRIGTLSAQPENNAQQVIINIVIIDKNKCSIIESIIDVFYIINFNSRC
jgi:hexokinase